jgi:hypothetical protein
MMGRLAIVLAATSACGRIGFDSAGPVAGDATSDGALPDGGMASRAGYVGAFATQMQPGASTPFTFPAAAARAGDLVLFQVVCMNGSYGPSTITAPGWTITAVGQRAGSPVREVGVDSFAAIAPDTAPATFTVTFGSCDLTVFAEEFANVAGGSLGAIDVVANSVGSCTTSITTMHANDTIWAACSGALVGNATPGYTAINNSEEYRITDDPTGTVESPLLTGTSTSGFTVIAIAPR